MQEIGNFDRKTNVIPNNIEKYMTFIMAKEFTFTDSMQFLNSSLASLVENLRKDKFKYLSQGFHQLGLLKKKRIYSYGYMNNFLKSY